MPEPDYVLAEKHKHRYRDRRPQPDDIELIIEVSDSTLGRDRGSKMRLYAAYGIKEYWILNLIDRQLELYTEPTETEGYTNRQSIPRDDTFVSPLLGEFHVTNVMPRAKWEEE
jgi:Uma2 family endonuclease